MEHHKTHAVVCQVKPHREYDKRVTLLTSDHGKLTAIAPRAKSSHRRFGAGLELLTFISISYTTKPHSSLAILQEVSIQKSFLKLKQSLSKIAYASYFVELLSEVMRDDEPAPHLFHFLISFLNALEKSKHEELLCRLFEARLLPKIGYGPELQHCVKCKTELQSLKDSILFSDEMGGILCSTCHPESHHRHISKEVILYLSDMILEKKDLKPNSKLGEELKRFLPSFLFYHLGKEPKSYGFVDKMSF